MNYLLIAVAAVFAVAIIIGIIRGGAKVVVSLATTIVVLALVFFITPYVSRALGTYTPLFSLVQAQVDNLIEEVAEEQYYDTESSANLTHKGVKKVLDAAGITEDDLEEFDISIDDIVEGKVTRDELSEYGISSSILDGLYGESSGSDQFDLEAWAADISKDKQYSVVQKSNLPDSFKYLINSNNNSENYEKFGAENFIDYVSLYLTSLLVHLVAFLFTFVLIWILIRALVFAFDIVNGLPSEGFLLRFFGGILGIADALIVIWLIFIVVTILYPTAIGKQLFEMVQNQPYLRILYQFNPIWKIAIILT